MRWNHRVWETDRATRLDRMGSPAKWMRERCYHPSRPSRPGLPGARTRPSKLRFLFSAPPPSPALRRRRDIAGARSIFLGKNPSKIQSCAFSASERAGQRRGVSITGAHYAKIPSTDALTPKCRSLSFSYSPSLFPPLLRRKFNGARKI